MSAVSTKRAWKLQEFVAHGGNVNCLALGHKTGRVMVTGGDDRKVNLWTVGKPNCIMSLSGHTSPVEAVRFGNAEELVVAGSMSGALKLWDLEQAKIIRTLTGHKANMRCLEFHPFGDFVASGSLDTNVKLWDIRRKGCIFTYKGHTNGVNSLRFSPDGRWVASAGEDSTIKIWDLAAGKLLVDLKQHSGPVNSIEFHPSEYLLASGSSDRSIRFWELEKFQCVDNTEYDNNAIRSVVFHPEGACIFGGSTDLLKVYGWEPSRCFDSVIMSWGKVADMAIAQTQLIGASINQTTVSTFVLDLTRVAPIGQVPGTPTPPLSSSGRKSFSHDRPSTTSTKQQMPISSGSSQSSHQHVSRQVASSAYINGMGSVPSSPCESHRDLFESRSSSPAFSNRSASPGVMGKRRSQSSRSNIGSTTSAAASIRQTKSSNIRRANSMMITSNSSPLTVEHTQSRKPNRLELQRSGSETTSHSTNSHTPRPNRLGLRRSGSETTSHRTNYHTSKSTQQPSSLTDNLRSKNTRDRAKLQPALTRKRRDIPVTIVTSAKPAEEPEELGNNNFDAGDDAASTAEVQDPTEYEHVFKPKTKLALDHQQKMDPFPPPKDDDVGRVVDDFKAAAPFKPPPAEPVKPSGGDTYRGGSKNAQYQSPATHQAPARQYQPPVPPYQNYQPMPSNQPKDLDPKDFMPPQRSASTYASDYEAISNVSKGHKSMSDLLAARNKNLQIVRAMWSSGNVRTALESAIQMQDNSVIVDVLNVLNDKPQDWSLDVADVLMHPLYTLLVGRFEAHVVVACSSLKLILKTYSPLIKQNLAPPGRLGVDITGEERHRRCMNIYRQIQDIRQCIEGKQYQRGKLENTFREIQLLLNHLDT